MNFPSFYVAFLHFFILHHKFKKRSKVKKKLQEKIPHHVKKFLDPPVVTISKFTHLFGLIGSSARLLIQFSLNFSPNMRITAATAAALFATLQLMTTRTFPQTSLTTTQIQAKQRPTERINPLAAARTAIFHTHTARPAAARRFGTTHFPPLTFLLTLLTTLFTLAALDFTTTRFLTTLGTRTAARKRIPAAGPSRDRRIAFTAIARLARAQFFHIASRQCPFFPTTKHGSEYTPKCGEKTAAARFWWTGSCCYTVGCSAKKHGKKIK